MRILRKFKRKTKTIQVKEDKYQNQFYWDLLEENSKLKKENERFKKKLEVKENGSKNQN